MRGACVRAHLRVARVQQRVACKESLEVLDSRVGRGRHQRGRHRKQQRQRRGQRARLECMLYESVSAIIVLVLLTSTTLLHEVRSTLE